MLLIIDPLSVVPGIVGPLHDPLAVVLSFAELAGVDGPVGILDLG